MRRSIVYALMVVSLSFIVMPGTATIHTDITSGSWFTYEASLTAAPSFGVVEFTYGSDYNVTVTSVVNDTVTVSTVQLSGDLPFNVTEILEPMIVIPTEMLVDNMTFGNVSIAFPDSIESDASKYWRGVPIRTADMSAVFDLLSFDLGGFGSILSSFMKYDNVTGMLYQIHIDVSLSIEGFVLLAALDISMTDANLAYQTSMNDRYDTSHDTDFAVHDIVTAPWLIPLLILSIVLILLVIILATSRRKDTGKNVTGKKVMTKKQREREIMKRRAEKRATKRAVTSGKKV